jgi:hypothetical protein
MPAAYPQVGDRVAVIPQSASEELRTGTCLFVGQTQFAEGVWVGIELDSQFAGKNAGSVQGVQYFECHAGQGVFVRPELVETLSTSTGGEMALRADIEMLRDMIDDRDAKIADLRKQLDDLDLDREVAQEEKLALEDEVKRLRVSSAVGGAGEAADMIVGLQDAHAALESRNAELEALVEEYKQRLEGEAGANELLEAMTEEKLVLTETLDNERVELERVRGELDKALRRAADLEDELVELKEIDDIQMEEQDALKAQFQKERDEFRATETNLRKRIVDLEAERLSSADESTHQAVRTSITAQLSHEAVLSQWAIGIQSQVLSAATASRSLAFEETLELLKRGCPQLDSAVPLLKASCHRRAAVASIAAAVDVVNRCPSVPRVPLADRLQRNGSVVTDLERIGHSKSSGLRYHAVGLTVAHIVTLVEHNRGNGTPAVVERLVDGAGALTPQQLDALLGQLPDVALKEFKLSPSPIIQLCRHSAAYARCEVDELVRILDQMVPAFDAKEQVVQSLRDVVTAIDRFEGDVVDISAKFAPGVTVASSTLDTLIEPILGVCGFASHIHELSALIHRAACDILAEVATALPHEVIDALRAWHNTGVAPPPATHAIRRNRDVTSLPLATHLRDGGLAIKRVWQAVDRHDVELGDEDQLNAEVVCALANAALTSRQEIHVQSAQPELVNELQSQVVVLRESLTVSKSDNAKLSVQAERAHALAKENDSLRQERSAADQQRKSMESNYETFVHALEAQNSQLKRRLDEWKAAQAQANRAEYPELTRTERHSAAVQRHWLIREAFARQPIQAATKSTAWCQAISTTRKLTVTLSGRRNSTAFTLPF